MSPKTDLALWLRSGRTARGLSIEDVARVTKIQPRILERLESGSHDGLPAEVFVRGFVRSFARCVGLGEDEALKRYAACLAAPAAVVAASIEDLPPSAVRAIKASTPPPVAELALASGSLVDVPIPQVEPAATAVEPARTAAPPVSRKKRRGKRNKRKATAVGTPSEPTQVVEAAAESPEPQVERRESISPNRYPRAETVSRYEAAANRYPRAATASEGEGGPDVAAGAPEGAGEPTTPAADAPAHVETLAADDHEPVTTQFERLDSEEPIATATWTPTMPPPAASAPWVPWRRPTTTIPVPPAPPSLVIDDADPDSAERAIEARAQKEPARRSFLPPILLDREDRSARQGGLTLAVILLLIAATLTLSYLMRRPNAAGDGMTRLDVPGSYIS